MTTTNFAIKASNGKYLSITSSDQTLRPISDTVGFNEMFELNNLDENTFTLKASNGLYVTIQSDEGLPLMASATSVSDTEKFILYNWGDGATGFVLLAYNKRIVKIIADTNVLQAVGVEVETADLLELTPVDSQGQLVAPPPSPSPSAVEAAPRAMKAMSVNEAAVASPSGVYTVCFCGTGCTRDEGEVSRPQSDKAIYDVKTGYIPVRIQMEISGSLQATTPSVSIRGVGENDWAVPRNNSEPLIFSGPLTPDSTLLDYVKNYSGGDQYGTIRQIDGFSMPALALHAANLAAASGKQQYNFIGHSRGAVEAIMAAWFIYAYGSPSVKNIPINIFAIDPVPGPGDWYSILTQLPPNVVNYVGVYAWDMSVQASVDKGFMALVPRPNGLMTGKNNNPTLTDYWYWPWNKWKYLADDIQLTDPLQPGNYAQPVGYKLYAIRGRHSTLAGNATADGNYDASKVSDDVKPVPELIYKMARAYLTQWGTVFPQESAVQDRVLDLRQHINTFHMEFDAMGGGETRNSVLPLRPYVRRISSIYGVNPSNSYYMDNAAGDPPYNMAYPVTKDRTDTGWVNWTML